LSYSSSVERALQVCIDSHWGQFRKGGDGVHYAVHPIHMALILARVGVAEVVIQGALLHDVVEDCEGWTITRVRMEFGPEVAEVVDHLTEDKSLSWGERKQWAIDHVPRMCDESVLVKAADKLHNLQSLAEQLLAAATPDEVWAHFTGGRDKTLAMDRRVVAALQERVPEALGEQLGDALARVEQLA